MSRLNSVTLRDPSRRLVIQRESLVGGEWWKTDDSRPVVLEDSDVRNLAIVPGERLVIEFANGDGSPVAAPEKLWVPADDVAAHAESDDRHLDAVAAAPAAVIAESVEGQEKPVDAPPAVTAEGTESLPAGDPAAQVDPAGNANPEAAPVTEPAQ